MFDSDKTKTNSGFNPDLLSNQFEEDKWLLLVSFIYWNSRYNNINVTYGKSMLCYTSVYVKNVYTHMVNICLELMFTICCKITRGSHTIHMSYTYVWSQHLWNTFGTFCCVVRQLTGMLTSKRESVNFTNKLTVLVKPKIKQSQSIFVSMRWNVNAWLLQIKSVIKS